MPEDGQFGVDNGNRIPLFGCQIDNLSLDEAAERVETFIHDGGVHRFFALNVHKVVAFRHLPQLRAIANQSDLVIADGQPVIWASRCCRTPLKGRVTGLDLMARLVHLAAEKQYRIYLLGARPEILSRMIDRYRQEFPSLQVVGSRDGYWAPQEEEGIVRTIREARPDMLFVGISSPQKELFMDRNLQALQVPFVMGVGGTFDVFAGVTGRAPLWMQRAGLEWFWRVLQEPRRMFGRYLWDGIQFSFIFIKELFLRLTVAQSAERRPVQGR